MLHHNTITDLQRRIALSEMKAYKELYLLLFDGLFKFSCSFVKSREAAEELVSDVFMKLWEMREQLAPIENLKLYLYRMTKNRSLNFLEKHARSATISLDELDVETLMDFKNPEELFISSEIMNAIKQAILGLPPQCRTIFLLVRDHGLKYKEVASILGVSVFTVRNQVAIATKKVAETLPERFQLSLRFNDSFSAS